MHILQFYTYNLLIETEKSRNKARFYINWKFFHLQTLRIKRRNNNYSSVLKGILYHLILCEHAYTRSVIQSFMFWCM